MVKREVWSQRTVKLDLGIVEGDEITVELELGVAPTDQGF